MSDLFIAGSWIEGEGGELKSVDPAKGGTVWSGHAASESQVDAALLAARRSFAAWRDAPLADRIAIVRAFAELAEAKQHDLAKAISLETGKPKWEALTEVSSVVGKVDISLKAQQERAGTVERALKGAHSIVRHHPHGVVGVLGPYNFPCHLPNGHVVPALLAGNALVLKASEHTPLCGIEMVRLWERAGLPAGVLNLLQGGREVGAAIVDHAELDGVLFTGSAVGGHSIHRRFAGRPDAILALEMGGNNPLVVEAVGDIDAAVVCILQSAYATAGQRCTCARRLLVPSDEFGHELVRRLVEKTAALRVGRPEQTPAPFMGPVISEAAADALLQAQARLVELGGRPLVRMRKLEEGTGLLSPGFIDVSGVPDLPDEEYFGPLLQLDYYDNFEEALQRANATRFGLAAGLIGEDEASWRLFLREMRAGIINWNRPLTGASSGAPFGGIGASGNHRPSAYYAADYCAYPVASLLTETMTLPGELPPGLIQ